MRIPNFKNTLVELTRVLHGASFDGPNAMVKDTATSFNEALHQALQNAYKKGYNARQREINREQDMFDNAG